MSLKSVVIGAGNGENPVIVETFSNIHEVTISQGGDLITMSKEAAVKLALEILGKPQEPIGYIDPTCLKDFHGKRTGGVWSPERKTGEYNQVTPIYLGPVPPEV